MRQLFLGSAAAAAITLGCVLPAHAQTAPAQETEIVIVTAQKREENLQRVPAAVSVLSGAAIENANAINIEGVTALVPALTFNKGGTTLNSSLFLRGVGTINFSIAAEPSVAFVLDGVVMARAGEAFGDLYDLQRMEVLRGPQGTLFGKNASAGVVNVVSRKAGDTFSAELEGTVTSDDEYKLRAGFDVPLGETGRSRITAFVGEFDGNVVNKFNNDTVNGHSRWGVRAVTDFDLSEKLSLTLIADYRKADDDCCATIIANAPAAATTRAQMPGVTFKGLGTREIYQDFAVATEEEAWGLSGQLDYELAGGHVLTSITAYRSWANTEFREGDFRGEAARYVGVGFASVRDFGPQESSTFSQEVRLTSPSGGALEYVLGAYYYRSKNDRSFRRDSTACRSTTLAPDATGSAPCTAAASVFASTFARAVFGSEGTNISVFASGTYDVNERLTLIGGLRFTSDEIEYFHTRPDLAVLFSTGPNVNFPGLPLVSTTPSNFRDKADETNLSGRAGVQYALTDAVNAYVTYTTGYKGPAFDVFFNMAQANRKVIEGETVESWEGGLKAAWWNGRIVANAALFRAEFTNFQANSPDFVDAVSPPIARLTNAGDISTQGFELDFALRPVERLRIAGGLALTDAQIEAFRSPVTGLITTDRAGERIAFAPEVKGSVSVDYDIVPADLPFDVRLSAQLSTVSSQLSSVPGTAAGFNPATVQPGYSNLDASVTFTTKDDRWSATVFGKNIGDTQRASFIENTGAAGIGFRIPRDADALYGITLRAKLGG
jgi:iron complex outermembrane receptor protein